jgi:hypothetical protein
MTKTTKSEQTKKSISLGKKYEQYIIDCIDGDGYDLPSDALITTEGKLRFLYETFIKEYGYKENIIRYGSLQNCFKEWLMGLPSCLNIVWSNYDILRLAKNMGSLPENATEKQEDKILENYWSFMAQKAFVLFRNYGIN